MRPAGERVVARAREVGQSGCVEGGEKCEG